jgi:diguanylate cyclase (GGDEF)-like protein
MMFKSPAFRLTLVLILLSLNLLLFANMIGLVPDDDQSALEMRKSLCESLALQFSSFAQKGEFQTIQLILRTVVERNRQVRSAAMRTVNGKLIAVAGAHLEQWRTPADGKSTPTQVVVPVFLNKKHWATMEIRFTPLWTSHRLGGFTDSFVGLLVFFGLIGFLCYFFVMKRALRELDPSAVIPERVQKAFDCLQEGVLILDEKGHIVMSNITFSSLFEKSPSDMLGLKGSELGWLNYQNQKQMSQLPWNKVLQDGQEHKGILLTLLNSHGKKIKLTANIALVTDNAGKACGTLLTFDDITQLEEKNFELSHMIERLQLANDEIEHKSQELKFLAECDPLTRCLNRRSLSLRFDKLFTQARAEGLPLACLMVDIDFFKSVNDRYGHATGDEVIKAVADVLKDCTRDSDLVGRYGGEEFCVVLPNLSLDNAAAVADRIRRTIEKKSVSGVRVTVSVGASLLNDNIRKPDELINQADKALYAAKNCGRNRLVTWGSEIDVAMEEKGAGQIQEHASNSEKSTTPDETPAQLLRRVQKLEVQLEKRNLELQHYEMFDSKTGLPTRTLFEDRINHEIARAKRTQNLVAVLSMTIDTVQRIQEAFGYKAAEKLVKDCGQRLNSILRENIDMVAAVKFDAGMSTVSLINQAEFGILLTDFKLVDHVTWVMKRLLDSFEKPFKVKGNEIHTSAYFGVSIFPHDGETVEELYCSATYACQHAQKLNGKDRYFFSSRNLNEMAVKQLRIENALYKAIQDEELHLYYQPKIEAATQRIAGFEALLRWRSKRLGVVPPDQFIPVAEQSGQIDRIGEWVIYNACRQMNKWKAMGLTVAPIAVNMSGLQLRQPSLPARIQEILDAFNIDAQLLEIELTESALVDSHDKSFANLNKIQKMGIRVVADDFGTGYSSLSYLRSIPLSGLKIDRSFVADINKDENTNQLIVSIVSIAHGLGLEVVAEGVEEKYQADYLVALGCEYMQGYYFGRPMPASDATACLQQPPMRLVG